METVRLSLPDVSREAGLAFVVLLFDGSAGRWVPHRMSGDWDYSQRSSQTRQPARPGVGVPPLLKIGGWDVRPRFSLVKATMPTWMRSNADLRLIAASCSLAESTWGIKGLPEGMPATEMDRAHRVAMEGSGYPQPIAGTDSK